MGSFWKNVITFGAYGRIEKEKEKYEAIVAQLKELYDKMEKRKSDINTLLLYVVDVKKQAIISLSRVKEIIKNLKVKDRELVNIQIENNKEEFDLERIEASLDLGIAAINASKGVGAGLATATSTYFLVGQFATASTGTAISTLSGAAATNATLAWLGGGSIATGGGGVAAGTAVMGGLIVIPALVVMGILSHFSANKEIKKIKEKEEEAYKTIEQIKSNLLALDLIEKRGEEVIQGIEKAMEVFNAEFKKVYKFIYPIPIISKLFKKIKKYFGIDYFNIGELERIQYLIKITSDTLKMVDTKVIE